MTPPAIFPASGVTPLLIPVNTAMYITATLYDCAIVLAGVSGTDNSAIVANVHDTIDAIANATTRWPYASIDAGRIDYTRLSS